MGLTRSIFTGTLVSSHLDGSGVPKCLTSCGNPTKLKDSARVESSIPPCLMVSMIARSLTERRPTSSTFRSMASNWFAVTCWLTSEASLLTFMFASGRETKFFL